MLVWILVCWGWALVWKVGKTWKVICFKLSKHFWKSHRRIRGSNWVELFDFITIPPNLKPIDATGNNIKSCDLRVQWEKGWKGVKRESALNLLLHIDCTIFFVYFKLENLSTRSFWRIWKVEMAVSKSVDFEPRFQETSAAAAKTYGTQFLLRLSFPHSTAFKKESSFRHMPLYSGSNGSSSEEIISLWITLAWNSEFRWWTNEVGRAQLWNIFIFSTTSQHFHDLYVLN